MKKVSLLMIFSMLIIVITIGCSKSVFNGNCISDDVQFVMDYSILNCVKTH